MEEINLCGIEPTKNSTNIYKVSLSLSKNGFHWTINEWHSEEKKLVYVMTRKDKYGDVVNKHLKKDQMMVMGSNVNLTTSHIQYHMYATLENIEEAKEKLMIKVLFSVNKMKAELDELLNHTTPTL